MTGKFGKRVLPTLPHPDHLRKQAKARLAAMRAIQPSARLTEAQSVLAREYGFASWAMLQAEVAQRAKSPRGRRAWIRKVHVSPFHPDRFRRDAFLEDEVEAQRQLAFFLSGAVAQIGFLFSALTGLALVFITPAQSQLLQDHIHALLGVAR